MPAAVPIGERGASIFSERTATAMLFSNGTHDGGEDRRIDVEVAQASTSFSPTPTMSSSSSSPPPSPAITNSRGLLAFFP